MKRVAEGCFVLEEQMPCNPRDITVLRWALPATSGSVFNYIGPEEAVARILSFSQQLDQWVGVSWLRLEEVMREEYEQIQKRRKERQQDPKLQEQYQRALAQYNALCRSTFGWYGRLASKPSKPEDLPVQEEGYDVPFTCLFFGGPEAIVNSIDDLVSHGLLKRQIEGKDENVVDVFFPTSKLIQRIMEAQGITTPYP